MAISPQPSLTSISVDENAPNHQGRNEELACLYTKHKTQKRKIWQDGRMKLCGFRAILYDANPAAGSNDPALDQCEVTHTQKQALVQQRETRLETERYLIEVEGKWQKPTSGNSNKITPKVSSSMKKLLNRKFQKPQAYIPPNPTNQQQNRLLAILGKRKRPLQPGELACMHHGGAQQPRAPRMGGASSQRQHQQSPGPPHNNNCRQRPMNKPSENHNNRFPNPNVSNSFQERTDTQIQSGIGRGENTQSFQSSPRHNHQEKSEGAAQGSFVLRAPGTGNTKSQREARAGAVPDSFMLRDADRLEEQRQQDRRSIVRHENFDSLNSSAGHDNTGGVGPGVVPFQERDNPNHEGDSLWKETSGFVCNEFNASSFYGVDEEEEEETHSNQQQSTVNPTSFQFGRFPTQPPEQVLNNVTNNNATDISSSGNTNTTNKKKISDTDLLALFGAAPAETGEIDLQNAYEVPSQYNSSINEVRPRPDNTENKGALRNDNAALQQSDKNLSAMQFVLPSQPSSSDDDSTQEGS
jgi:hypothetical protein